MNSTSDKSHFSLFDSSLENLFDMAESMDKEGASTILSELASEHQRYWISNKIAEGGSKKVVKVKDSATNRHVAMAVLKDNESEEAIEEFLREARLTAFLQHPNIMPVYDIGVNSINQPYFTMKLIKGGFNLATLIRSAHKFDEYKTLSARLEIFLKICDGVAFAHSRGIIHLDLKPENIQLDDFGQVLVCDWGLARFIKGFDTEKLTGTDKIHSMDFLNITVKGVVQGTPGFMAPEQASTKKTEKNERTDIYSLGALLYYLLSFKSPLKSGKISQMLSDTLNGNTIPLKKWQKRMQIPDPLIKVCQKAMRLSPDKRYDSVVQLQKEVRAYMDGYATSAEHAGFVTQFSLFYLRNKLIFNLIVFSFLAIISVVGVSIKQMKDSEQKALKSEQEALLSLKKLRLERIEKKEIGVIASEKLCSEAITAYYGYNYRVAYEKLNKSLQLNPENGRTLFYLGWLSITAQKFDEARTYFRLSLENGYSGKNTSMRSDKFMPVIDELEPLINPKTRRIDEKVLNEYISKLPKNKYVVLIKHLLYRHRNDLLDIK